MFHNKEIMNTQCEGLGNTVFDVTEAFNLGYENWYEPINPYIVATKEHTDYELGKRQAFNEM